MEQERDELRSGSEGDSLGMNKPFVFNCPYLGTLEDSDTSLAYPAAANHCFRVASPASVELSHQENYCLTDQHSGCHVFQMVSAADVVPESEAPAPVREKKKLQVSLFALPLILILLLLAAIVWWPAPGTTLQDSLALGAQNDREVSGGVSLNDNLVSEPVVVEETVEVTTSEEVAEAASGVYLNESASQANEESKSSSSNVTASNSAENEPIQSSTDAVESVAPNPSLETADSIEQGREVAETATEETNAAVVPEISDVGTSSIDVELVAPTETTEEATGTETFDVVKSSITAEQSAATETTAAAIDATTSDAEIDSGSADETVEAAEQEVTSDKDPVESASDEEESTAVTTADLPILSSDIPAVTTAPPEGSAPPSAGGGLVALVGPSIRSALSLHASVEDVDELQVYQAPTSDSKLLSFIGERQFVTLLGRDESGSWLNVRLNSGTEGWIDLIQSGAGVDASSLPFAGEAPASEAVVREQPIPAATSFPVIRSAYVDTGALNVRSGPGVQYEPITIINSGELVGLIGRRALGPWVRIRLDSGLEGWVNSSLLAKVS